MNKWRVKLTNSNIVIRNENFEMDKIKDWVTEGIKTADENLKLVQSSKTCKVNLIYNDEENSWSSWKPAVSGISFGFVPVKFYYVYDITVKGNRSDRNLVVKGKSWRSIFLFPFFFATTSHKEFTNNVGEDIARLIVESC